jgi:hypothetical protein
MARSTDWVGPVLFHALAERTLEFLTFFELAHVR